MSISDFQKILLYIIQILSKLLIKSVVRDLHIIQLNLKEQRQGNEKCISPEIISQLFSEMNGLNQEHNHLSQTVSALRTLCLKRDPFISHSSMKLTESYSMYI